MLKAGMSVCAFLIVVGYSYHSHSTLSEEVRSLEVKLKEKEEKNTLNEAKLALAQNPRISNIIQEERKLNIKNPSLAQAKFVLSLRDELMNDALSTAFYQNKSNAALEIQQNENGFLVHEKWTMFVAKTSPFYENFPYGSALVYNNEKLNIANCQNSEPVIVYASLSTSNKPFEVNLNEQEDGAYRIVFSGNYNPIKDRAIIKVGCST